MPSGAGRLRGRETFAVVAYSKNDPIGNGRQADLDAPGAPVLQRVGHGFLGDPV